MVRTRRNRGANANARVNADSDSDVEDLTRQLHTLSDNSIQRVIRSLNAAGRLPGPAAAPVAVTIPRNRRPTSLQIPIFEDRQPGTEGFVSVELFLRTVKRETRIGDYDDLERVLIARDHVRGHARIKFDNANLLDAASWQDFEEGMKDVFSIPAAVISDKLHELVFLRKTGESLSHFIERLSSELNNYSGNGDMGDEEKLPHLKRILRAALPQEMRLSLKAARTCRALIEDVVAHADGQPQLRLTEVDIANEKEERKNQTPAVAAATATTSAPTRRYNEEDEEGSTNLPRGRSQPTRGRGTGRARAGMKLYRCDGCGGNHARSTCNRSRNAICYNCGTLGHLAVVCRKNARAAT